MLDTNMSSKKNAAKTNWNYLGYVPTWIVGTQYAADKANPGDHVYFEPEADNPVDPLAMAVFSAADRRIGYLPRYDAAVFTPAINDGILLLRGQVENCRQSGKQALKLEVYASTKAADWFKPLPGDNIRDILHNTFLNVWNDRNNYSAATLTAFRDILRAQAHQQCLHCFTSVLYRLLRGTIDDKIKTEKERGRQVVGKALAAMVFGNRLGGGELSLFPLFKSKAAAQKQIKATTKSKLMAKCDFSPKSLVLNYAYPTGAHGAVICSNGILRRLCWFNSASEMEIYWFQLLMASQKHFKSDAELCQPVTAARLQRQLQKLLSASTIESGGVKTDGKWEIALSDGFFGQAILNQDEKLIMLDAEFEARG